jgi:hypothetical protein
MINKTYFKQINENKLTSKNMKKLTIILLLVSANLFSQKKVHFNAFAHNDYEHERPLLDALAYGYNNVEADVHLIDGELYVYHDKPDKLDKTRTLENLYLNPLLAIVKKNGGFVYKSVEKKFYLMIDIKTDALKTYFLLRRKLEPYKSILSHYKFENNPVEIFISGNRAFKEVMAEPTNLVKLDGRISDLDKKFPATKMPVISDSYGNYFKWDGNGDMPKPELDKLRSFVTKAHAQNKMLRFWGVPHTNDLKKLFIKEGVDLIGEDELEVLVDILVNE